MASKAFIIISGLVILLFTNCNKKYEGCAKMGYEYVTTASKCWYSPIIDSIPLNSYLTVEASVPKTFIDQNTNTNVLNTAAIIEGPFRIIMLHPIKEGAIENFEIIPRIGAVRKDTIHASIGQLKNFRTLIWDANNRDSFTIKLELKALVRGVYGLNIGQQGYRDKDCALYKYFLKVGNTDQHLNYLAQYNNGYISDYERNYAYCFKVY